MAIFTLQDVYDGILAIPQITPPSLVNYAEQVFVSGTTSDNMSTPSGMLENDIMFFFGVHEGTGTLGFGDVAYNSDGFTTNHNSQNSMSRACGFKVMGATPDTTFVSDNWTGGSTTNGTVILVAIRGGGTPAFTLGSQVSGAPTSPAVTVTAESSMVLIGGCFDDDTAALTAPTGYTLIRSIAQASTGRGSIAWAYKICEVGTETPGAWGGYGGSAQSQGISYLIPPA